MNGSMNETQVQGIPLRHMSLAQPGQAKGREHRKNETAHTSHAATVRAVESDQFAGCLITRRR
jgi:hypothetical protein